MTAQTTFTPAEYERLLNEEVLPALDAPELDAIVPMPERYRFQNNKGAKFVGEYTNLEGIVCVDFKGTDGRDLRFNLEYFKNPAMIIPDQLRLLEKFRKTADD